MHVGLSHFSNGNEDNYLIKIYFNISNSTFVDSNPLVFLMNLFSVDELRKLLSDKDAYHHFLLSLDQVKLQNNVSCGLCSLSHAHKCSQI